MVKQTVRTKKQVGKSLKEVRLKLNMPVKYLSRITGLSRITIKATEEGLRYPDLVHLATLKQEARANGVQFSIDEVVYK